MLNAVKVRGHKPSEDGYMLLAAIFLLFLFAISLTIAAPIVARSIQRDREVETMYRGMQYRRAVQLYYRKFGAYPPSIDALVKTQNIRFLRKRYIDPMTGKDDWKPVLFGQNKAPLALGFFGEPLAAGATALAGTGPSGGNSAGNGLGTTAGSSFGSGSSGSGSGFGSGSGSSLFGPSGSGQQNPTSGSGTGPTSGSGTGSGTSGTSGQSGSSGSGSSSGSGFMSGQTGQTFGGAGIVGFSPAPTLQSILTYKKMNHYNEWEFTYSPLSEQKQITGGNAGSSGLPGSGTTGTGGNTGSSFFGGSSGSGSTGGSTFGGGSSIGGSGTGGTSGTGAGPGSTSSQPQF